MNTNLEKLSTRKILNILESLLETEGIKFASKQRAFTTSSIYLKFDDERLRSLTVRDHPGIPKYRYKWNLFKGWQGSNEQVDRGVKRFYYSFNDVENLAKRIIQYKKTCEERSINENINN